jgi:hypothetical protein
VIFQLIVITLCVARLCRLVIVDDFPPIQWARETLLTRWPTDSTVFGDSVVVSQSTDALGYRIGLLKDGKEVFSNGEDWYASKTYRLTELLECPWCLSPWVALIVLTAWWFYPDPVFYASLPFAISFVVGETW